MTVSLSTEGLTSDSGSAGALLQSTEGYVDRGASGIVTVSSLTDEAERDLFGIDLLFTDDLQVTASGDYATITGLAALRQAIRIVLITTPGEYAVNPTFGCGLMRFVKKRATKSDRDTLRQVIIEQLTQDSRIQKVDDVLVESLTSGNLTGVKITVKVTALGRENSFAFQQFAD